MVVNDRIGFLQSKCIKNVFYKHGSIFKVLCKMANIQKVKRHTFIIIP